MSKTNRTVCFFLYAVMWAPTVGDLCPYKECQCEENVIECENMRFTTLPTLVIPVVSWQPYLTLNSNFITSITKNGLPAGLSGIDFEGNPITNIDQQAFEGSENTLTDLKFSGANFSEFPFAFFYLNKLEHLSIRDTPIQHWDPDILSHLGDTLQTLTLINVGLTEWPSWIQSLPHLIDLELSSAKFSVPYDGFNKQTQALLSLTMENVTLTSTNIFSELVSLYDLMLNNNNISQISGLPNFGNLTTLSLNNNNISDGSNLNEALRSVAGCLGTLYLSGNRLTTFPDLSFMLKLETLFLSDNFIYNTHSGTVPASLKSLGLESNKIATLANFLRTGTKLTMLRLRSNSITELRGIDIPSSVYDMDISYNLISELTDTSFPYNSSMAGINFDFNPVSTISSSAFVNTPQLRNLSIKNAKLSRLPLALAFLRNAIQIDLSGNPDLVCTCMEKSLHTWSQSYYFVILGDCGLTSIYDFVKTLSADCPNEQRS